MSTSCRKINKARKKNPDVLANIWIIENIEKSETRFVKKISKKFGSNFRFFFRSNQFIIDQNRFFSTEIDLESLIAFQRTFFLQ